MKNMMGAMEGGSVSNLEEAMKLDQQVLMFCTYVLFFLFVCFKTLSAFLLRSQMHVMNHKKPK